MAEVREAVLANTMLAALAGEADQRVAEQTMVVTTKRQVRDDLLPELPERRIERQLGRAGSASVYAAIHLPTNRRERVYCLRSAEHPESFLERYLEEYRKLAATEQPNLVTVYEVRRHMGFAFVAAEELTGGTLTEAMRRKLPIGLALNCLAEMCMAVDALHDAGIIHGALQADDFAFREDRVLVLAEFNTSDRVRASLGLDSGGNQRQDAHFDHPGRDLRAIGRIFHAALVGTTLNATAMSQQTPPAEVLRATRLPLALSPVQPCVDRLLGVGNAPPIERAADVLVELLSPEGAVSVRHRPGLTRREGRIAQDRSLTPAGALFQIRNGASLSHASQHMQHEQAPVRAPPGSASHALTLGRGATS